MRPDRGIAMQLKKRWVILVAISAITGAVACATAADESISFANLGDRPAVETERATPETGGLSYQPPQWPEPPDTGSLLLRLAGGTFTVLAMCVATLLAGKRWLRGPVAPAANGSQLQLIDTVVLGNRCTVHLMRAGRHQVIVGMDGSGMKSLVALPESFEKSLAEVETEEAESNV